MTSDKVNYEYKGLVSNIFIPIIVIVTLLSFIFKMEKEYVFVIKIVCFVISVLLFIISIIKVSNKDLGILKYFGIGSVFIALLRFIDIETYRSIDNNGISLVLNQVIIFLEIINILTSMNFYKKRKSISLQFGIYLIITPIIYLFIYYGYRELPLILGNYSNYYIIFLYESILIMLYALAVYLFYSYSFKKDNLWILLTSLLIISSSVFIYLSEILALNLTYITLMLKLVAYFLVYEKFEEILLSNAFSSAYESLNKVKEIKSNLNKSLIRREKELLDLNLLIEKSEKRYYDVVQAFSNGLLLFENNILTYSNYYEEIYYDINDIVSSGNSTLELNKVIGNITGKIYLKDDDIKDFTTEIIITNGNGERRNLEIYLVKIYGSKKILVFNDITDIVNKRKEIAKIEKKINEENIKEEFYSNISHELRTPINVIYSALQLNDLFLKNNEITRINKNNNVIKQNCLRLIRTISNFIDSNKLSEGFLEIDKKIYNVVEIIESIVLACNYYMKMRSIDLIFDPGKEEIKFLCDKSQIERIMLNILSNSLKYGKEDGHIYVTINIENDNIVIKVVNDAEAIPEDKRKDIFEKFTKVNSSLNRPSEGSGLGLFLTKGLVENHNGEISINTGKKYGNTFKIIFPYNKDIEAEENISNTDLEINELKEKIDIEFSDIYF